MDEVEMSFLISLAVLLYRRAKSYILGVYMIYKSNTFLVLCEYEL